MEGSTEVLEQLASSPTASSVATVPRGSIAACIHAVSLMDQWILERIKRDGFIADACRFPSITHNRLESMNDRLKDAGLSKALVFKDGGNEVHLVDLG